MEALVTAFYGCLSECIDCSHTKKQRKIVSRKIQCKPFSCPYKDNATAICTVKGMFTGSYLIWAFGSAVYRGDCNGIGPATTTTPVPQMINIRSKLRPAPDLCKNVSLQCYLVVTVIHIQSRRNEVFAYTYVFFTI